MVDLIPHQPGTAVVSGTVRLSLVGAGNHLLEMPDTVSFQVTVPPFPESTDNVEAPAS